MTPGEILVAVCVLVIIGSLAIATLAIRKHIQNPNRDDDRPIWFVAEYQPADKLGYEHRIVWESARMPKKYAEDLLSKIAYSAAKQKLDNWFTIERDDD